MAFNAEQAGAYILLLCYQWMNGTVPNDDQELCAIGRCSAAALVVVKRKFIPAETPGQLVNHRLESIRQEQDAYRTRQAEYGKAGGRPAKGLPKGSQRVAKGLPKGSQTSLPLPQPPSLTPAQPSTLVESASPSTSQEDFFAECRSNPAYAGIDVDREWHKMSAWCLANRQKPTRRRFVNWLNRADKPLTEYRNPKIPPGFSGASVC